LVYAVCILSINSVLVKSVGDKRADSVARVNTITKRLYKPKVYAVVIIRIIG